MPTPSKNTRDEAGEKIIRLHKTMHNTLAAFPHPVFVLGKEGRVQFRNRAAEELAVKLLLVGEVNWPPAIEEKVHQVLEKNEDYLPDQLKAAIIFKLKDIEKAYLPRILLLREEQNEVFGVAIILEDVTNLRLSDELKSGLVATVSHELKTPLTSIRMAIYLLIEESIGPLNEQQRKLLELAKNDSERLLRTLNNLLDLSRLEESRLQLQTERCSVAKLMEAILQESSGAEREGFRVTHSIEPGLPDLELDLQRVGFVFSNFLSNSVKHSPPGSEIQIKATRHENGGVRISVKDQGKGISPEHQPFVFEKFFRVPGQSVSGAGLGLAIAREIAAAHGAKLGVESELGKGSDFFIDFAAQDLSAESKSD